MAGRLIVAVLRNQAKQPLFSVEERLEMIAEVVKPHANVEVAAFEGCWWILPLRAERP
jgi:pantetheine-phosphate adenylyltransferase